MSHKYKSLNHPRIESLIREISQLMGANAKPEIFEKIFTDLTLIGSEHQDTGDHKLIQKSLAELHTALKLFFKNRDKRKVAIFGSGRISSSHPNYKLAFELAQGLVRQNYQVISGAGGGIMAAVNQGAGPGNSYGLNIKLPMEQSANPFIENHPHLLEFKYVFIRKLVFIKESSATVLLPGGGLEPLTKDLKTSPFFKLENVCPAP
jgi:hypothetical protein